MPLHKSPEATGLWFIVLIVVLLSGCAHPPQPKPSKPDWTSQGSGAFHIDRGTVFQGAGMAEGITNSSLLRAAADNRARAQLASVLDQYANALFQYAGYDRQEMATRLAISTVVHKGLGQALITDHWYDQTAKRLYANCILELAVFKRILMSTPVSGTIDETLAEKADQVFKAFAADAP